MMSEFFAGIGKNNTPSSRYSGANPESHLHITHLHISYLCKYVKDTMECTQNPFAQKISRDFSMVIFIFIFSRDLLVRREKRYNRHRIFTSSLQSSLLLSLSTAMLSKNYMLMAVAMHLTEEDSNTFIHSRYRKEFYTLLSELEKSRRYRQIPRCALPLPRDSPWRRVFFPTAIKP